MTEAPPPRRPVRGRNTSYRVLTRSGVIDERDVEGLFRAFDLDSSGTVDPHELADGLRFLGIPATAKSVAALLDKMDTDKDGRISMQEFKDFVRTRNAEIEQTWRELGAPRGEAPARLSSNDIRIGIENVGLSVSDEQLRSLVSRLDVDGDGVVSYAEFQHCLMLLPEANPAAVIDTFIDDTPVDSGTYDLAKDVRRGDADTSLKICVKLAAGAVAGALSRTATAPLDRIRALMQAAPVGTPVRGLATVARDIWREGGARAFFRGNAANCVKIAPETAVRFALFDTLKRALARDPDNVTMRERFVSGGLAGAVSQTIIYPLEIVKTRMSVSPAGVYSGMVDCLRKTLKYEGVRALYQGLTPTLAGLVPYAGIDLAVNSSMREHFASYYQERGQEPGFWALLSCGMVSSCIAMWVTYPLNLVRTRLQASGVPGMPQYDTAWGCFTETLRRDGVAGLYRGIVPNMMKVLPAASISVAAYDVLNRAGSRALRTRRARLNDRMMSERFEAAAARSEGNATAAVVPAAAPAIGQAVGAGGTSHRWWQRIWRGRGAGGADQSPPPRL